MSAKIIRLKLSEKLWVNPTLHEPKKKKGDSLVFLFWVEVTFEWYEGAMVFRVFIIVFYLETKVRENNCMGTTPVAVMVIFFRGCHFESTWSQLCSKFFVNNYEAPWQRHLKHNLYLKILRTWISIGVDLQQDIWLIIVCFFSPKQA